MEKETPSIKQRLELLRLKVHELVFEGFDGGQQLVDKLNDTVNSMEELIDILLDGSR